MNGHLNVKLVRSFVGFTVRYFFYSLQNLVGWTVLELIKVVSAVYR